jgi:hypothetical protein
VSYPEQHPDDANEAFSLGESIASLPPDSPNESDRVSNYKKQAEKRRVSQISHIHVPSGFHSNSPSQANILKGYNLEQLQNIKRNAEYSSSSIESKNPKGDTPIDGDMSQSSEDSIDIKEQKKIEATSKGKATDRNIENVLILENKSIRRMSSRESSRSKRSERSMRKTKIPVEKENPIVDINRRDQKKVSQGLKKSRTGEPINEDKKNSFVKSHTVKEKPDRGMGAENSGWKR